MPRLAAEGWLFIRPADWHAVRANQVRGQVLTHAHRRCTRNAADRAASRGAMTYRMKGGETAEAATFFSVVFTAGDSFGHTNSSPAVHRQALVWGRG